MKYCTHDDRTKDSPFLYHDACGKVVSFFVSETKQSFEHEGQTQVEFLMTHPVYPAAVGCDLFSQLWRTDQEYALWSSRDRFKKRERT